MPATTRIRGYARREGRHNQRSIAPRRHRSGLRVGIVIIEGTANFLVKRRMNKSQQMRWSRRAPIPFAGSLRCLKWHVRFCLWTEIPPRERFIPADGRRRSPPASKLEAVPRSGPQLIGFVAMRGVPS
jgi:hypothetical protein